MGLGGEEKQGVGVVWGPKNDVLGMVQRREAPIGIQELIRTDGVIFVENSLGIKILNRKFPIGIINL